MSDHTKDPIALLDSIHPMKCTPRCQSNAGDPEFCDCSCGAAEHNAARTKIRDEIERIRSDHAAALVLLNARRNAVQAELDEIKGPIDMKKEMVCVGCLARITATIQQAKEHGWAVWVGGARCKACCERSAKDPANER